MASSALYLWGFLMTLASCTATLWVLRQILLNQHRLPPIGSQYVLIWAVYWMVLADFLTTFWLLSIFIPEVFLVPIVYDEDVAWRQGLCSFLVSHVPSVYDGLLLPLCLALPPLPI